MIVVICKHCDGLGEDENEVKCEHCNGQGKRLYPENDWVVKRE
jgi:DnaJ-class molecular chaperone